MTSSTRSICTCVCAFLFLMAPRVTDAQFLPPGSPVVGERYRIEASGNLWFPSADLVIASEALRIPGDNIDLVRDLGIDDKQRFREFRLVLRPADKHKFKLQYVPLSYSGTRTIVREFVFNGIRYRVGLPVQTQMDWKMLRVGYEYDFFYRERGYAGFMLDARFTEVGIELDSPIGLEFARARTPVPSIGFTGRFYPVPNAAISSEVSFFKIPETLDESFRAEYVDIDIYGTVNFVRWAGVQVGWRRFNIDYRFEGDSGDVQIGGMYLAGVLRY